MFRVVSISTDTDVTLTQKLNSLEAEGWFPVFAIWNGEGIVCQHIEFPLITLDDAENYYNTDAVVEVISDETEERLREP
jgi:hypothetical protein